MKKCKVCNMPTRVLFNIDSKVVPICQECATAIFLEQAVWYSKQKLHLPITAQFSDIEGEPYDLRKHGGIKK